jgi:hypothetical protein
VLAILQLTTATSRFRKYCLARIRTFPGPPVLTAAHAAVACKGIPVDYPGTTNVELVFD